MNGSLLPGNYLVWISLKDAVDKQIYSAPDLLSMRYLQYIILYFYMLWNEIYIHENIFVISGQIEFMY